MVGVGFAQLLELSCREDIVVAVEVFRVLIIDRSGGPKLPRWRPFDCSRRSRERLI